MPLEATLILLDNSSYSLDGDYLPTRWMSQLDSASLLIQAKLEANQESSVGLGLMGGKQVDIICTLTSDAQKVNAYLHGTKIHGDLHFSEALQIGALALKYRANPNQKARIVCFICSKIEENVETLTVLAKKLKKSQVAVDLICFGDCSAEQKAKVEAFINNVNMEENSCSIFIEERDVYLNEKLVGSKIFGEVSHGAQPGAEEMDPELAEAIRMSLMEAQGNNNSNHTSAAVPVAASNANNQNSSAAATTITQNLEDLTEEELERLAIQMSLDESNNNTSTKPAEKKE